MEEIIYQIKVADLIIKVVLDRKMLLFDSWCLFINTYLRVFLVRSQKVDLCIHIDGPDKKFNNKIFIPTPSYKRISKNKYRFNNLLSTALFLYFLSDIIIKYQSEKGFVFLHGSGAIDKGGRAYLFLGKSGAGKSTCLKKVAPSMKAICEDVIPVKIIDKTLWAYPYPSNLKIQIKTVSNTSYQVVKLIVPQKSNKLDIVKVHHINQIKIITDAVINIRHIASNFEKLAQLKDVTYTLDHTLKGKIDKLVTA